MPLDLADLRQLLDTVVIVVLENRSFDHVLGHLSYGPFDTGTGVDGLREPLAALAYENVFEAKPYYPFLMQDGRLPSDVPHEREEVERQLAFSAVSGRYLLGGFVDAYYAFNTTSRTRTPEPMGFLPPSQVPISHFLATHFAVCDRWFTPLPTSTLPNRLMAWTGSSRVDRTGGILPPRADTILEWLQQRGIPWRVYHSGLSFFALLGEFGKMLGPNFKRFERLAQDVQNEADATFPNVILVEPAYGDAPHFGTHHPNDNHPPLPMGPGEQFLRLVYRALTGNPERWRRTALVVMYDEHGGFFDHVPPLPIGYDPRPHASYPPFLTTGLRVPAMVVSPLVGSGVVHKEPMDHTSVLQFVAEMFAPAGGGYSSDVNRRRSQGITSVARVFDQPVPRSVIPVVPSVPIAFEGVYEEQRPLKSPQQVLFENAARQLVADHPDVVEARYPEISYWAQHGPGA